jgi:3-oxoacyl-[acyl-carrier-protein] synthase-3
MSKKYFNTNRMRIEALCSVSPSQKIDIVNEKSSDKIKRLSRSIGIKSKFVCGPGQRFATLAEEGINWIVGQLQLRAEDIDGVIVVTQSPDYIIPGTAVLLQDRCRLSKNTLAYDINLGCSGFPYGLFVAYGHLLSGMKRVLVVVGDQSYSPGTTDEGHGVLFGDAASVASVVLRENGENSEGVFSPGSDGGGYEALYIPHGGKVRPVDNESFTPKVDITGVIRTGTDVVLDGPKIHNFSVGLVPNELHDISSASGWEPINVDYFVLHQANKIINDTIRAKLKLPLEKFPETLSDFGNTSSASIPVTMTARLGGTWNKQGAKTIMCGFGIGLSWSSLSYVADGTELSHHYYCKNV